MIEDAKLRSQLHNTLQELENKVEWEGGLAEMILSYGGWDMFPETCQKPLMALVTSHSELLVELRRLSAECGFEASVW